MQASGKVVVSRIRIQSDVWRFPVRGSPAENTRGATRITHQTGQAQTPSVITTTGVSGANPTSGDIDVYFCLFTAAGAAVGPTSGSFACLVDFTGQEG